MVMHIDERFNGEKWDGLTLANGGHASPDDGLCAMEAVAFFTGEIHTDQPSCVCPVITRFVIRLNDRIRNSEERTALLKPVLPLLPGTSGSRELEIRRGYLCADFAAA